MDRISSLEAKFNALMIKLNQQALKEPTIGEIAYMQAQGAFMESPPQIEDVNYVNNVIYTFRLISTQIVKFRALFIAGFMHFLCTNRLQ